MIVLAAFVPAAGFILLLGMARVEARLLRAEPVPVPLAEERAPAPLPVEPAARRITVRTQPPAGDPLHATPRRPELLALAGAAATPSA